MIYRFLGNKFVFRLKKYSVVVLFLLYFFNNLGVKTVGVTALRVREADPLLEVCGSPSSAMILVLIPRPDEQKKKKKKVGEKKRCIRGNILAQVAPDCPSLLPWIKKCSGGACPRTPLAN